MVDLVLFLVAITAVVVPTLAFVGEQRRRHRSAIAELLSLAEAYAPRDALVAGRFEACADSLAVEYLDDFEKQPVEYSPLVNVAAFVLGVAATVVIGVSATETGSAGPTAAFAGGLTAGAVILALRPLVHDVWTWLRKPRFHRRQP